MITSLIVLAVIIMALAVTVALIVIDIKDDRAFEQRRTNTRRDGQL